MRSVAPEIVTCDPQEQALSDDLAALTAKDLCRDFVILTVVTCCVLIAILGHNYPMARSA